MRNFILLVSVFISTIAFSQNWLPIDTSRIYHYGNLGDTIPILDVFATQSDSGIVFNEIILPDGTNTYSFQPIFLGSTMKESSPGVYQFIEVDTFVIDVTKNIGESWQFTDLIPATLIAKRDTIIDGVIDSIMIIGLTPFSVKKVIISKNNGILQFPDISNGWITYYLHGIQNEWGFDTFGFWEIYDFEVGDVFQYWFTADSYDLGGANRKYSFEILDKEVLVDGYQYQMLKMPDSIVVDKTYTEDGYSITNTPIAQYSVSEDNDPGLMFEDRFYLLKAYFLTYDHKVFGFSNELGSYGDAIWEGNNGILMQKEMPMYRIYERAMGKTKYSGSYFEWGFTLTLQGYVKNGDTTGTVFTNEQWESYVGIRDVHQKEFALFPNPTKEKMYISWELGDNLEFVEIVDVQGRVVKTIILDESNHSIIDISDLERGFYFVMAKNEHTSYSNKVLIE